MAEPFISQSTSSSNDFFQIIRSNELVYKVSHFAQMWKFITLPFPTTGLLDKLAAILNYGDLIPVQQLIKMREEDDHGNHQKSKKDSPLSTTLKSDITRL